MKRFKIKLAQPKDLGLNQYKYNKFKIIFVRWLESN